MTFLESLLDIFIKQIIRRSQSYIFRYFLYQAITNVLPLPSFEKNIPKIQACSLQHNHSQPSKLPNPNNPIPGSTDIDYPPFQIINISMKFAAILAVFLLLTTINAQKNEALLALSWIGGFCEWAKNCIPSAVNAWDHQSFTIHGYWVQQRSSYKFGEFNVSLLSKDLLKEMRDFWPAQTRQSQASPTFLWEHEFDTHGADFADIYLDLHPEQFKGLSVPQQNVKLQQAYFSHVIDLYKTLKVRKIPQGRYSKADFAKHLGLNVNQFSLVCNEGTATLQEIRICFDLTAKGSVPTKCRSVQARNCKNNEIVFGEWKVSAPTSPVTKA